MCMGVVTQPTLFKQIEFPRKKINGKHTPAATTIVFEINEHNDDVTQQTFGVIMQPNHYCVCGGLAAWRTGRIG